MQSTTPHLKFQKEGKKFVGSFSLGAISLGRMKVLFPEIIKLPDLFEAIRRTILVQDILLKLKIRSDSTFQRIYLLVMGYFLFSPPQSVNPAPQQNPVHATDKKNFVSIFTFIKFEKIIFVVIFSIKIITFVIFALISFCWDTKRLVWNL